MKYTLAKARKLAVALDLNPELDAGTVYEFEKIVNEVLADAHAAALSKDTRNDVLAAIAGLADKDVPE